MKEMQGKETVDWNALWKRDQDKICGSEDVTFWDSCAPRYRKVLPEGEDPYVEQFYEYSGLLPGETIFDMGCGSGTLAIPFALKGHEIYAADFSPEMLKYLRKGAEEAGVADRIHTLQLDWNEDWSARDLPLCDVAISSRSFIVKDLSRGILNLESVARRRVCVGAWDTPGSGYIRELAREIGYERPGYGCYVYVMGELMDRDMMPELRWIVNPFRRSTYDSREEAIEKVRSSFTRSLSKDQERALEEYCRDRLRFHEEEERSYWKFDVEEISTIAFIRWDKWR